MFYCAKAKSSIGVEARQVCRSAGGSVPNAAIGYDNLFVDRLSARRTYQRWVSGKTNLPLLSALLLTTTLFDQTASQHQSSPKAATDESVEVHLGKGYEALKQDRYDDAAENFRAALKVDPTLVMRARFPLAIALFQLHSFTEARHELETVRREVGERPSICYYFGRLDPEEQNYKSAVANLNKAIAKPPFPDTAYFLGFAYLKEGSDQDAEKWLKEAAKRNPEDSRAEYQLALLYKKEGREEEAQQAFSRTKEQRDQSNKLSQLKWDCAHELDRGVSEQAITICEQLDNPDDAEMLATLEAHRQMLSIYRRTGRAD